MKIAVIVSEAKVLEVFVRDDEVTVFDILKDYGNMSCQVSNRGVQN